MKEIVLFRHAKSSWATPEQPDFERPLNGRGRRAAPAMARWLLAAGGRPEMILCSAAARTQETLRLVQPLLEPATVVIERALYLAGDTALQRYIERIDPAVERAMVIAHNPGLETLARRLDPGGSEASEALARKFPTAAIAWFRSSSGDWRQFLHGRTTLVAFKTPADLQLPEDP